jgi:hypothetical protein
MNPVSTTIYPTTPLTTTQDEDTPKKPKKVKRRDLAATTFSPEVIPTKTERLDERLKEQKQPIRLSVRAAKLLTAAIPSLSSATIQPLGKAQSSLYEWQDFLHSMSLLGFEIAKRGGSIWRFTKPGERSFLVHEPHPERKLDFTKLRWIGKRLGRNFGYCVDDFIFPKNDNAENQRPVIVAPEKMDFKEDLGAKLKSV